VTSKTLPEIEELDIDTLVSWPGNARKGDVAKIAESLRANNQYRAIIVWRRPPKPDMILCGHHVRDAVVMNGGTTVRAEIVECDEETARRIHLSDNATSDGATYDDGLLAFQLEPFNGDFTGTGFTAADYEKLLYKGMPPAGDAPTDDDGEAQFGVVVELDSEQEQAELLARLVGEGFKVRALIQG
jgi:hypothetical protein